MAQFNPKDPRYQRDQQRAAAIRSMGPSRLARPEIGRISGQHAAYQLDREQQFRRLALASALSKGRYDLNRARLKQVDRRMNFQDSDIDRAKKGMNITIGSGLLGSVFSVLEGRKQDKALKDSLADQALFRNYLETSLSRKKFKRSSGPYRAIGGLK